MLYLDSHMYPVNTITNSRQPGDLLGHELSTLLVLLNDGSDVRIRTLAASVPAHELRTREAWFLRKGSESPNWLLGCAVLNPLFQDAARIGELRDALRKMVRAWIATGDREDSSHTPLERSIGEIDYCGWRAKQGPQPSDVPAEFLFEQYTEWRRCARFVEDEGNAEFGVQPSKTWKPDSAEKRTPLTQAFVIVSQLLRSDGRFNIAQCHHCGKFFFRKRTSRAKRGLYCSSACLNKVSAAIYRDAGRETRDAKRLERAVKITRELLKKESRELLALHQSKVSHKVKAEIRDVVNAGRPSKHEEEIKLTWVSRNWSEIVKALQTKEGHNA
jgi:predicted RNA-binding Zn ribbon-like protein